MRQPDSMKGIVLFKQLNDKTIVYIKSLGNFKSGEVKQKMF